LHGLRTAAVASMSAYRKSLVAQRATLDAQIAEIDSALRTMGAGALPAAAGVAVAAPARRGGRAPRKGSMKEFITAVLGQGGVWAVKDVSEAIVKAGYKSRNQTLAKSVGIALAEMPQAKKIGRGRYQLK